MLDLPVYDSRNKFKTSGKSKHPYITPLRPYVALQRKQRWLRIKSLNPFIYFILQKQLNVKWYKKSKIPYFARNILRILGVKNVNNTLRRASSTALSLTGVKNCRFCRPLFIIMIQNLTKSFKTSINYWLWFYGGLLLVREHYSKENSKKCRLSLGSQCKLGIFFCRCRLLIVNFL